MARWQLAWTSCLSALGRTSSLAEVVIHNPEWVDETSTKSQGSGNDMRPHDNTQLVCNIYHANVFHRRRLRDCIWTAHVAGLLACSIKSAIRISASSSTALERATTLVHSLRCLPLHTLDVHNVYRIGWPSLRQDYSRASCVLMPYSLRCVNN